MTDNNTPALRPVTVEVPGDVLLDLDGVPVAVGNPRKFSGLLYGWGDLITNTADKETH